MFQSRLNTERLEDYRWELRTTWTELDKRAGLSSGWTSKLARGDGTGVSLATVDKLANAIASLMHEANRAVPEDLWFQLVTIEIDQSGGSPKIAIATIRQ